MAQLSKKCNKCKKIKKLTDFYRHKETKDGRNVSCKPCMQKIAKLWAENNPQRRAKSQLKYNKSLQGRYKTLLRNAASRDFTCFLSFEDYISIISKDTCSYCGGRLSATGTSIDRVNSKVGYSLSNCVSCCFLCNYIFNKYDKKDVYEHLKKMIIHQEQTGNIL